VRSEMVDGDGDKLDPAEINKSMTSSVFGN
jgi:hypothetical protein